MRRLKIIGLVLAGIFLTFLLANWVFPLPDRIEYSTIITDDKGEVVHAFLTRDQQWRMKTELSEISPLLRKTIVEKEDKYFFYHPGVNVLAMARAFGRNLVHMRRTSGASTITMQVARALEPKKRTYWNKAVEVFRAVQLEWKYSKREILQLYLNIVPYGGNIQGVKAASILYFKKNPDHLSLAEITALSIIPNRPSSLVMGRNNDRIVEERNKWLRRWEREKVFTAHEIEDALGEPLTATRGVVPSYMPQLSWKLKKRGGPIVHSTIQMNTQLKVEKLVRDYSRTLALKNIHNAAVVVIDNRTHRIVSYVGSADFDDALNAGQVNGAAAVREPGSTLKPLLYGLCIDEGLLTPKRTITDVPINYDGYAPENYDKRFNGYVTMEYALEHSLNIPAVKSLKALGKDKLIQRLSQCDFRQIDRDRKKLGLSMILGGCGATLEEMTGLYSIFANEGVYVRPRYTWGDSAAVPVGAGVVGAPAGVPVGAGVVAAPAEAPVVADAIAAPAGVPIGANAVPAPAGVRGVVPAGAGGMAAAKARGAVGAESRGVVALGVRGVVATGARGDSVSRGQRILSPAAVFMINETLSKVNRPDFPLNWQSTLHLPKIAWKTGTSYGRRDAWSIGYNKHFTVGVWAGNFSGLGVPELSGANVATPLLFTVFNTIDYDDDAAWFAQPEDCDVRMVCSETGLPPDDFCRNLVTDYFIPLVSTAKKCDNRQEVFLSADGKISYCRSCLPPAGYKKKWFMVIPPEMKEYYDANHITYEAIPPHNPACEKVFKEGAPVVTSPASGSEYLINRKDPEPLLLRCRVTNDVAKVYWYINDKFYRSVDAGSKEFFMPDEGPVKISCTDDKGRNRNVWIRVKYVNL